MKRTDRSPGVTSEVGPRAQATAPTAAAAHPLLALQRQVGNRALVEALGRPDANGRSLALDRARRGVSGNGQPVPYRTEMEAAFGASFATVRAHLDRAANRASAEIGARAYTLGEEIAFAEPSPSRPLVAHEMAHVLQQRRGELPPDGLGLPGDPLERAADRAAERQVAGAIGDPGSGEHHAPTNGGSPPGAAVQRSTWGEAADGETPHEDTYNDRELSVSAAGALNSGDPEAMRRLPMAGLSEPPETGRAIVVVPPAALIAGVPRLDVLMHFHGLNLGNLEQEERGTEGEWTVDLHVQHIEQQLAAAGAPLIGIIPQFTTGRQLASPPPRPTAPAPDDTPEEIAAREEAQRARDAFFADESKQDYWTARAIWQLDPLALIADVLARLREQEILTADQGQGRVVMSGHSAGGVPSRQQAEAMGDAAGGLFLFDGMNRDAQRDDVWSLLEDRLEHDSQVLTGEERDQGAPPPTAEEQREYLRSSFIFRSYGNSGGGDQYGERSRRIGELLAEWFATWQEDHPGVLLADDLRRWRDNYFADVVEGTEHKTIVDAGQRRPEGGWSADYAGGGNLEEAVRVDHERALQRQDAGAAVRWELSDGEYKEEMNAEARRRFEEGAAPQPKALPGLASETLGVTGVVAATALRSPAVALPHRERIQAAFGRHDLAGIEAHVGGAAAAANQAMGSLAFAYGDHVAFGDAPDLHTAAHEAAHVIQQRAGAVPAGYVSQPGDPWERHANRVADRVVRGESAERLFEDGAGGRVMRKAADGAHAPRPGPAVVRAMSDPGAPVDPGIRQRVERATGAELSAVRVHTGEPADRAAGEVAAQAFTVGQDIHFAAGRYGPGTAAGDRLITHELVHTIQQGSGGAPRPSELEVSAPGDAAEQEADRQVDRILAGEPARMRPAPLGVARQEEGDSSAPVGSGGGFDELVARVEAEGLSVEQRRQAVTELVTSCRANLPDRQRVEAFLDGVRQYDHEEAMHLTGELARQVARMEFLLGSMRHENHAAWETTGNRGPMVDEYQDVHGGGDGPWCARFFGYAYSRLSADDHARVESHFDSGYKLRRANEADEPERFGNLRIDRAAFAEHKRNLEAVEEPDADAQRLELTRSFVAAHGAPHPGEALIVTREGARRVTRHDDQADEYGAAGSARYANDFTKQVRDAPSGGERTSLLDGGEAIQLGGLSHTTMVDTFDSDRLVISTVEGNSGQAVSSQRIDLTVPEGADDGADGVGRCIALVEVDPARFHYGSALAGAPEPAGVSEETLGIARQLVDEMREYNRRLAETAGRLGAIEGGPDGSVYEWRHGGQAAATPTDQ